MPGPKSPQEGQSLEQILQPRAEESPASYRLVDGSRVAVIGGGPAGSFFSYFLLDMAENTGLDIRLDLYEPRDYTCAGPAGCNHCGGIISESLVQILATEGINLPTSVVQRGIDSYHLHMDVGSVLINTPLQEKRIAAVFRGAGPRGITEMKWGSFDGFLQGLALNKGAHLVTERVKKISWDNSRPQVATQKGTTEDYDLVVAAVGVNASLLKILEIPDFGYKPPETTKTYICEYYLGEKRVHEYLGTSMHVFLLNLPRLEFAALVPKGDYVTVCMLGEAIDKQLVESFLGSPEVKACLPPDLPPPNENCHCSTKINIRGAAHPFTDRLVLIGDCGVSRLYKDGIGAAYRTAKAAAKTVIFRGISAQDFEESYLPALRAISRDNAIGKFIFAVTRQIQGIALARRGILRMTRVEQEHRGAVPRMSTVLWDVFTGSAPYREVLVRTMHPSFVGHLLWNLLLGIPPTKKSDHTR